MTPLDIAVIGAGTAGSAAALLLARDGHRVSLFEAVEDPKPVGAGIMIQPSGMAVLRELDLLDHVMERGSRVDRLRCITSGGRAVIDLAYADLRADVFGVGLHRGVLFDALLCAVRDDTSIDLRLGAPVEDLALAGGRRALVAKDGARLGEFDLVVAADGARSQLRDDTGLVLAEQEYPWGALWFIGEDPERSFDWTLFQVVEGTTKMLGFLPSGLGPEGDTPRVSMFWSIRGDLLQGWREAGLEPWKQLIERLEPRAEPLLAQIEAPEQVLYARYFDVRLASWNTRDVVYLGDSAHATSPQLGQGANLALVDASCLARSLRRASSVRAGLTAYSDSRRAQLDYYQFATRALTPFFQSDVAPLGWARDAFMGLACRAPYVRSRMIRTMCGLERGILGAAPLPMPSVFHRYRS